MLRFRKLCTTAVAAVLATSALTVTQAVSAPAASAASSVGPVLGPGAAIGQGQCLHSPGGAYALCLQTDGNVVEYGPGGALWTTGTGGRGGATLVNQSDGNLVLYGPGGSALWASGGRSAAALVVQTDGNVVTYAGSTPTWTTHTDGGTSRLAASTAVAFARAQIGKPYVWGAAGPGAYDCSGLTMAAFAAGGVRLPHRAALQFGLGTPVAFGAMIPGDLVFSYSGPGHVGIYIGNGQMINSPNSRGVVRVNGADLYGKFVGARRVS